MMADIMPQGRAQGKLMRAYAYQIMTLAIYNFSCDKMDHRYDDLLQFGRLQ
jgi:hypothetical protein